ncbi:MAG: amidohydrolase [Candidatus Glassbacteria bacterium]
MRLQTVLILVAALLTGLPGCAPRLEKADLVLTNGRIVTMDAQKPEATALAIRGDILIAVGSDEEIREYMGEGTKEIDLEGCLTIPGFIEGHAHFLGIGRAKLIVDLTGASSWDEIVDIVKDATNNAPPGAWIIGRGWHQEKWTTVPQPNVDGLPLHHSLSEVSPKNPVYLTHASGHAAIVNGLALELAGIDRFTPDPPGGQIVRDGSGEPIGVLREKAKQLVLDVREKSWNEEETRRVIELAADECLSKGITSFQDAGSSFRTIDLLKKLTLMGKLPLRLWVMIEEENEVLSEHLPEYRLIGFGDRRLTVRAIKRYMDGALGTHSAWLFEPYADLPQSRGLNTSDLESLAETAQLAIEHGFQLCIHAIGDRANHETLNLYQEMFRRYPSETDLRWRIEHAQHLRPDDISRFAALGVIASVQGIHCTSDGPWVIERLGERRAEEGAYVWRKLIDSGAVVINGTDSPVEDVSPVQCFYASVSRKLKDGSVFFPSQRMSREEALRSYTINAAFAAFEEEIKGSLAPGKLADITVLSRDIMTIPEDEILDAKVLYTIVGGKVAYKSGE